MKATLRAGCLCLAAAIHFGFVAAYSVGSHSQVFSVLFGERPVQLLRSNRFLYVQDFDGTIAEDHFIAQNIATITNSLRLRSASIEELFVCRNGTHVLLSPLLAQKEACEWTYNFDDQDRVSLHSKGRYLLISNELPALSEIETFMSVTQVDLLTKRNILAGESYVEISRDQDLAIANIRLLTNNGHINLVDHAYRATSFPEETLKTMAYAVDKDEATFHYSKRANRIRLFYEPLRNRRIILSSLKVLSCLPSVCAYDLAGVRISIIRDGQLIFAARINEATNFAVIPVANTTTGTYDEGLVMYHNENLYLSGNGSFHLVNAPFNRSYLIGRPSYPIVDNVTMEAIKGKTRQNATHVNWVNRLLILATNENPHGHKKLALSEVYAYNAKGTRLPLSGAISSSGGAPFRAVDGNHKTAFLSSMTEFEMTQDQFVIVDLPPHTTSISRVDLVFPYQAASFEGTIKIHVLAGQQEFETYLNYPLEGLYSIPVPTGPDGTYPTGLIVKDPNTREVFYIEQNTRHHVSSDIHRLSGYIPFYFSHDSRVTKLKKGKKVKSIAIPDDYLVIVKERNENKLYNLALADIKIYDDNSQLIPITASDVFFSSLQTPATEDFVLDGDETTWCSAGTSAQDLRETQFIRVKLPEMPGRKISKIELVSDPSSEGLLHTRIHLKFMKQVVERRISYKAMSYSISLYDIPVHRASLPAVARKYPLVLKGHFPGSNTVQVTAVTNEQCAQQCDYKLGCVGFTLDDFDKTTCSLIIDDVENLVPSNHTSYIASKFPITVHNDRFIQESRIYRYIANLKCNEFDYYQKMNVRDCAAACDSWNGCIAYYPARQGCRFHLLRDGPLVTYPLTSTIWSSSIRSGPVFLAMYPVENSLSTGSDITMQTFSIANEFGLLLRVDGETRFRALPGGKPRSLKFESKKFPGKFICAVQYQTLLSWLGSLLLTSKMITRLGAYEQGYCDWSINAVSKTRFFEIHNMAPIARDALLSNRNARFGLENPARYDDIPLVSFSPSAFMLVVYGKQTLERPYTSGENELYTGASIISTFPGSPSQCSQECDELPNCVGYSVFADQKGCDLLSSLGIKVAGATSNRLIVKLNPYLSGSLSNALPWQLSVTLYGDTVPRSVLTGMGIHIHLIDSGITKGFGERGFYNDLVLPSNETWHDTVGHADFIAGILRNPNGAVPGVSVHNIKIFDSNGLTSPRYFVQAVADVLQKATKMFDSPRAIRPTIVSISAIFPNIDEEVMCVIEMAYKANIFIVAAAGNDMVNVAKTSPASGGYALVVGGYERDFGFRNSNYGSLIDVFAATGDYYINNRTKELTGTSLAAPQVTALLAKMLYDRPELQTLPPIYAYNVIRAAAFPGKIKDLPRGTPNYLVTARVQQTSAYTRARSLPTRDFCKDRNLEQIVKDASTVLSGKLVTSPITVSACPNEVDLWRSQGIFFEDENVL